MVSLISFILVCIGCINWFSIGILQFDFVAGLFGSQSNLFSRLIYTLVGIASLIVLFNFITNKGKFVISFKKAKEEYSEYKEEKKLEDKKMAYNNAESAEEFHSSTNHNTHNTKDCDCKKPNCDCNHKNK